MGALAGQAIFVTGPAKGMGRAITVALARAGADVVLAARDVGAMQAVAAEVSALGRMTSVQKCDVTRNGSVAAAVRNGRTELGDRLDGLVCVAGTTGPTGRMIWESTAEDFRHVFDTNVLGVMLPMRHVLPHLIAQARGSVVSVGGTFGFKGVAGNGLYGASKWALRGLGKSAALEAGPHGVRINSVCPGGVDGPRLERQLRERAEQERADYQTVYDALAAGTALGRMSVAEDVAGAIVFLMSDAAGNITGQDLLVDGGTIV